ncbi:MAG: hypothetical protein KI792_09420 [Alphaproteobacteria bacterium]|nr:hypothetical protein [Alphaproteobacteria bacterium SS10]
MGKKALRSLPTISVCLALAIGTWMAVPSVVPAQNPEGVVAGSGQMPLVFPAGLPQHLFRADFQELQSYAFELDAFQQRLVENVVIWADGLNSLEMRAAESLVSFPFYIEGGEVGDRQDLRRSLQQWYLTEALDGYREKQKHAIRHLILHNVDVWLETAGQGQGYEEIFDDIRMSDGYVVEVVFVDPEQSHRSNTQIFFVTKEDQPRIAGIWDYRLPQQ